MNSMENTGVVSNSLISMDFDFDGQSPYVGAEFHPGTSLFGVTLSGSGSHDYSLCSTLLLMNCGIQFNAEEWTNGTYTDQLITLNNIIRKFNSIANTEQKRILLADAIFLLYFKNIVSYANLRACGESKDLRIADCLYKLVNKWLTDKRRECDINKFIISNLALLTVPC